ncbi:MAG: fumarate hydratase C-terminal domain-containing protein [Candidatus Omnitrophica bacterium]|nr:fumarate hydratase C-terminal domain-containing protein [Candidatus Omnitrophota bacterium]
MKKHLLFPLIDDRQIKSVRAGDEVEISGTIYVARDAAHKKLADALNKNKPLPLPLKGSIIYYMGPTPAPPGKIIGSCGPTTSSRMDKYTLPLLQSGLKATMGKGGRSEEIAAGCKKYKAVYLIAYGGCGAYLNRFVKKSECFAYCELGPEAIYKLEVKGFPAIAGIDIKGKNIYNK